MQDFVVFFTVHKDLEVPEHSHGPQWGALFSGRIQLTINGVARDYKPGDTWDVRRTRPRPASLRMATRTPPSLSAPRVALSVARQ